MNAPIKRALQVFGPLWKRIISKITFFPRDRKFELNVKIYVRGVRKR
jgi:hypothetical protein